MKQDMECFFLLVGTDARPALGSVLPTRRPVQRCFGVRCAHHPISRVEEKHSNGVLGLPECCGWHREARSIVWYQFQLTTGFSITTGKDVDSAPAAPPSLCYNSRWSVSSEDILHKKMRRGEKQYVP